MSESNSMSSSSENNILINIPKDYVPIVYKFPNIEPANDIFKYDEYPSFSRNIDYPKFSLGFHHYIHQSKTKMEITKEFENKKKVYFVINKFERYVDNYEGDLNSVSKEYFNLNDKPNILSRAFYKLWELFFMFDLVDLEEENFVSAHLAEGPGSFIQATMFYRDKFAKKGISKNDKYHAVTLHSEGVDKHIPKLEQTFIDYYKKEKPVRFEMHKTFPREEARISPIKDNGDITDPKTIKLFGGRFEKVKANFITADGGFDWENENIQEQEAFKLILAQIIMAVKIQMEGGSFVCKLYESFTNITSKNIAILSSFYNEIYLVKPLTSRSSNSEKYAVCMDFKYGNSKEKNSKIQKLENVLNEMNQNKNLVNMFPDFLLSSDFKTDLISVNTEISNKQYITINEMVEFIKKQNYRGDEYQRRRLMQIEASKYWVDKFFPQQKEFAQKRKELFEITDQIIKQNNNKSENLERKLDFN